MGATVTILVDDLARMIEAAAECAVSKYIAVSDPRSDLISQRKAWSRYGRRVVETLVAEGRAHPRRAGVHANSKVLYSDSELYTLTHALDTAKAIARCPQG